MQVYVVAFLAAFSVALLAERVHDYPGRGDRMVGAPLSQHGRRFSPFALAVGVILIGVSALRWQVGTDYRAYDLAFPVYAGEASSDLSLLGEPGIRIIAWVAMRTSGDSALMFAIAAVITVGLMVRTLWKWSPAFAFAIAVYVLSGAWFGSFNAVRQFLACAVLFAGHRFVIDRNIRGWIAVVVGATMFHLSALFALLFYLVPVRRTSAVFQVALIGLGFLGMVLVAPLLDYMEALTGNSSLWGGAYAERSVNPLRVLFAFVPLALYWLFAVRAQIEDNRAWFYINMLAVYVALNLASATSALAARFNIYVLPFVAIGLAYSTSLRSPLQRTAIRVAVLMVYGIFMYVEVSTTENLRNFQWLFER